MFFLTGGQAGAVRRRSELRSLSIPMLGQRVYVHDQWHEASPESTYLANSLFRRVWCRRGAHLVILYICFYIIIMNINIHHHHHRDH